MDFWTAIKNFFGYTNVDHEATIVEEHRKFLEQPQVNDLIPEEFLPEALLDANVGLYRYGYDTQLQKYKVLYSHLEVEIRC